MKPGSHYVDPESDYFDALANYEIRLNAGEFVYILPSLINSAFKQLQGSIDWYVVSIGDEPVPCALDRFTNLEKQNGYVTIGNIERNMEEYPIDIPTIARFRELQGRGWGQIMSVSDKTITFRVRMVGEDDFIISREPSIYESVFEIAYFSDMTERLESSSYTEVDRFEVRTSGFIARRRNGTLSRELYDVCNDSGTFEFDPLKIAQFLRNRTFDQMIRSWFPREETEEEYGDSFSLTNVKDYSICVYRYKFLSHKSIARMAMIESWMIELGIRGGFVLMDGPMSGQGYLFVVAEAIKYGHSTRSGDLHTFLSRYDSLHWKRVSMYDYRNKDCLFKVDIDDYPETPFAIRESDLDKPEFKTVKSLIDQF